VFGDGFGDRVESTDPAVLGRTSARQRRTENGDDPHILELIDEIHEAANVDSLVFVLCVV
jgi:hypothetical protein